MKRLAAGISLLVPVAAGAVRWLDLVNFCDLTTGFVTLWPAFWRPGGPAAWCGAA